MVNDLVGDDSATPEPSVCPTLHPQDAVAHRRRLEINIKWFLFLTDFMEQI